jgi:hypothetical protein
MSKRKRKNSALINCRNQKRFWTTQKQFWQWVRDGVVAKTADRPLTGSLVRENEETMVLIRNTVLNLAHPHHLREVLESNRFQKPKYR